MRAMRDRSGFTLLEVLVAFTIFALTTGAVMATISTGLNGSRTAAHHAVATLIAESKLAAAGIERPLSESENSGSTDTGYDWRITVQPIAREEAMTGTAGFSPSRIDVTVSWANSGNTQSISMSTVRAEAPSR